MPTSQSGFSQIIIPILLVASIGLAVFLVQQRTNILPRAETAAPTIPNGCKRIDLYNKGGNNDRRVFFKDANDQGTGEIKSNGPEYEMFGRANGNDLPTGEQLRRYEFKDTMYRSDGWEFGIRKRKGEADVVKETGFENKYYKISYLYGNSGWAKYYSCETVGYNISKNKCLPEAPQDSGEEVFLLGTMSHFDRPEFDGFWLKTPANKKIKLPGGRFYMEDTSLPDPSYEHKDFGGKYPVYFRLRKGSEGTYDEEGVAQVIGSGTDKYYQRNPDQIFMYVPKDLDSNLSCLPASTGGDGKDDIGDDCDRSSGCKSGICRDNKCAKGSKGNGSSCQSSDECTSGTCSNGKCGSGSSGSPSPGASASASASIAPGASIPPGAVPVSLTKTEITGFKTNYAALDARLGAASNSGNLKITATIAKTELASIVSELPTCPDDANVGKCVDDNFRTRFDFAKTAARLSAFYAIFNDIKGICVKADFGLNTLINPLISAKSATGVDGRVSLCNDKTTAAKAWKIFAAGVFSPIDPANTTYPPNPSCATLPNNVASHYRDAEKLFNNQEGFISNTLCDGKTSVAPGDDI